MPGPCPARGSTITNGCFFGSAATARLRLDAEQHVIDRPLEGASVDHQLVIEHQDRRLALLIMLDRLIAALAHHVPEQNRALAGIDPVVPGVLGQAGGGPRCPARFRDRRRPGVRHLLWHPLGGRLGKHGERRPGRWRRSVVRGRVGVPVGRAVAQAFCYFRLCCSSGATPFVISPARSATFGGRHEISHGIVSGSTERRSARSRPLAALQHKPHRRASPAARNRWRLPMALGDGSARRAGEAMTPACPFAFLPLSGCS